MDRRVKRTKAAVFNAMIALMIEKETDKITVLELCKKADINKSTFYLHFKSMGACIQFCFETITNGIVEIAKGINYDQIQRDPTDIINSMLNEIERNNNIERLTKFKNSRMCAPALRHAQTADDRGYLLPQQLHYGEKLSPGNQCDLRRRRLY